MSTQIVIAQRGWVWIGRTRREGDQVIIEGARCIRRWGTSGETSGLATLAAKGPQPQTVLEDPATVRIHVLAIVAAIDCNDGVWDKVLG